MAGRLYRREVEKICILALFAALAFTGCPNPNMRLWFKEGKSLNKNINYELLEGALSLRLDSFSRYPCGDYLVSLYIDCRIDDKIQDQLIIDPFSVKMLIDNVPISKCHHYINPESDTLLDADYNLSLEFCGDGPWAGQENDSKETNNALEIKIVLDSLVCYKGEYIKIDTIYAIEKKGCPF